MLLISAPGLCLLSNLYFSFSQVLASLEPKITHCTCCCFLGHRSSRCLLSPHTSHPLSPLNPCCKRFNMEPFCLQSLESSWMPRSTDPAAQGGPLSPNPAWKLSRLDPHCPAKMTPPPARTLLGTSKRLLGWLGGEETSGEAQHDSALSSAWPCLSRCWQQHHSPEPPVQPHPAPPRAAQGRGEAGPGTRPSTGRARGSGCSPWSHWALQFPSLLPPVQPNRSPPSPLGKHSFVPCVPSWNDDLGRDLFYANKSLLAVTSTGCWG